MQTLFGQLPPVFQQGDKAVDWMSLLVVLVVGGVIFWLFLKMFPRQDEGGEQKPKHRESRDETPAATPPVVDDVIPCPECHQMVPLPKDQGISSMKCPHCKNTWSL